MTDNELKTFKFYRRGTRWVLHEEHKSTKAEAERYATAFNYRYEEAGTNSRKRILKLIQEESTKK